jgi:CDP-diacylglycerol--glycerol-3-phosphate 3-phosphatidyltransferase
VHIRLRALPNAITVMRLAVAIAFFVVVERLPREPEEVAGWIAVGLFAFAAATDVVDGYLARRWDAVTPFGRVMDPFVDKVLVIGGLILLAGGELSSRSGIATWMAILVLGRELLVTSVRAVVESSGGAFPADWAGKVKMLLQSLAIPVALGVAAIPSVGASGFWRGLSGFLTWAMLAATVGSALPYVWRAAHMLRPAPRVTN